MQARHDAVDDQQAASERPLRRGCEKAFKIRPWVVHHVRAAARSNLTGVSSPFTVVEPRTVYVRRGGMSCAEG